MVQINIDSKLLNQQVLVAALPDSNGQVGDPEVHLAWLMPSKSKFCLREASISGGGEVDFGRSTEIELTKGTKVQLHDRALRLLGSDGRLLVQMHMESDDDGARWTEGIQAVIGSTSDGDTVANHNEEDEVAELRARSAALADRICELETVGSRRDKQLNRMVQRLEGAMKMLAAVQEMCNQQGKVIEAQKNAIRELRVDNGVDVDEATTHGEDQADEKEKRQTPTAAPSNETPNDDLALQAMMETAIREKDAEKVALLNQVEMMQTVLQQLEGLSGVDGEEGLLAFQRMLQALPGMGLDAEQLGLECKEPEAEDDKSDEEMDDEDVDPAEAQEVLSRLQALEAEKKRMEDMLSSSQKEQEDLLKQLNAMEALKASMGWAGDSDDGGD